MKYPEHDSPFLDPHLAASGRLDELQKFLDHMEGHLRSDLKWVEEEAHVDLEIEYLPLFGNVLPPILYSSVALSAVIFLEVHLKRFCELLQQRFSLGLRLNDLSGSTVERFKKYSEKVAGLEIKLLFTSWEDIIAMFEIRNCFVHQDGDLSSFTSRETVEAFLRRHKLPAPVHNQLKANREMCELFMKLGLWFVDSMYAAAYEKESPSMMRARTPNK